MKKYIPLFYTVAFLMLGDILVMAGQTTLTTYYPAPSGNYNHLTTSNIGIGTVTSANALEINGPTNSNSSMTAVAFLYSSDQRLKANILPITGALDKVQRLDGVTFTWKKSGAKSMGVVAQNVEKVLPEIVHNDQNGMKSVEYGNLVAIFIEAFKEQQKEIKNQQKEIEELEQKLGID